MFDHIKADLKRYSELGYQGSCLRMVWDHQGIWALFCYRYGRFIIENPPPILFRPLAKIFYHFWWKLVQISTGIYIPATATIGPGLYIGHFGPIIVGPDVIMGRHCNISQGVTIGLARRGGVWGVPEIGDRVYIAPGAKIFGPIVIEDGVVVGANAVLSKHAPKNSVWAGIPARVIAKTGSADYMGEQDDQ